MARPSTTACTRATFTDDVACLRALTSQQRKAYMVYLNVLELAALGGTDYINELGPNGDLIVDAKCDISLDPEQKSLALLLINQGNAEDAGATIPATVDDIGTAVQCLVNQSPAQLDAMALHVQCLLGRHAAYPQVNL